MIGTTLSHYRITAKLGEGGMGEVYRATDIRLGREVAIKVLPAEMAASEERLERFRREAQALAALDHPNIVHVYSVESAEWTATGAGPKASSNRVHFMTMQLVDGEPLDSLVREGGLEVGRIIEIGNAIAEALAAAHVKGIVHRDLKPANVIVTGQGRVKVLDFGLAKIAASESDTSLETEMPTALLTREGIVMGTVPYMSPEQITGRALDPRTDLFSLGVLLYEMAAGQRPFAGRSSAELASAILRDKPEPLVERRSDLPPGLARVIERCLEKDPEARFASARELCEALSQAEAAGPVVDVTATLIQAPGQQTPSRVQTPASSSARAMDSGAARAKEGFWVAVLPFRHRGAGADVAALAEGLTEDTVTGLARFSYLKVVSQSSSSRYADGADVRMVGKELGARYVMKGSLRRVGKRLRVTVRLIDTESGTHLWAETYDRDFDPDDLFTLQDDLVPRIVSTSADHFGVLARAISEAVRGKPLDEITPYEALMRGFGYHFRLTPEEHAEAREALERAVEQAPSNADCWAMLAWIYAHEYAHGFNPKPGSLDRALSAARRAVDLAPSNHLAQQVLAVALFFRKEIAECLSAAERSMELNPLDGSNEAIFLITFAGDWERGSALIRRSMELNPHHPGWYRFVLSLDEYRRKEYVAAVEEVIRANMPGHFWALMILAAAYAQLGDLGAARKPLDDLLSQRPDFADTDAGLLAKWFQPEMVVHLMEGLRKAGLGDARS